ncbi:hypothetical protein AMECASPLE_017115, partial [Ameca splendens]
CDEWTVLPRPDLHHDVNRFGHTAVFSDSAFTPNCWNSLYRGSRWCESILDPETDQ